MDCREHLFENAIYAIKERKSKKQWFLANENTNIPYLESGNFGVDMVWNLAITVVCYICRVCKYGDKSLSTYSDVSAKESPSYPSELFVSALIIYKSNNRMDRDDKLKEYMDSITSLSPEIKSDIWACISYIIYTYCPNCKYISQE